MTKRRAYINLCENINLEWEPKVSMWVIDKFTEEVRLIWACNGDEEIHLAHPDGQTENSYTNEKDKLAPLYYDGCIVSPSFLKKICEEANIPYLGRKRRTTSLAE